MVSSLKLRVFAACTKLYKKKKVVDSKNVCSACNITTVNYSRVATYVSNWKTACHYKKKFKVGDTVEANRNDKGKFFPAKIINITEVNGRKLFSVVYGDKVKEERILNKNIRQSNINFDEMEKEMEKEDVLMDAQKVQQIKKIESMLSYLVEVKDNEKLDNMRFHDLETKMEKRFMDLDNKFNTLFEKIDTVKKKRDDELVKGLHDFEQKFEQLEGKVLKQFEQLEGKVLKHFKQQSEVQGEVLKQFEQLEGEVLKHFKQQSEVLKQFKQREQLETKFEELEDDVLNHVVRSIDNRMVILEQNVRDKVLNKFGRLEERIDDVRQHNMGDNITIVGITERIEEMVKQVEQRLKRLEEQNEVMDFARLDTLLEEQKVMVLRNFEKTEGVFDVIKAKLAQLNPLCIPVLSSKPNDDIPVLRPNDAIITSEDVHQQPGIEALIQITLDKLKQSTALYSSTEEFTKIISILVRFRTHLESFVSAVEKSFVNTNGLLASIQCNSDKILDRLPEKNTSQIQIMSDQELLMAIYNLVQEMNNTKITDKGKKRKRYDN